MKDSRDSKRGLDHCSDFANTSDSEDNYLNARIYFRKKLISALKDIKELLEENIKQKEKLHDYELENDELRKTIIDLNTQ